MEGWLIGLLVKPVLGLVMMAALLFTVRFVAIVIYRITPDCRLKRYLFDGWERHSTRDAP